MYSISTILGLLIAAVLYVPGTTQREAATVGEEPVEEEVAAVTQERWFLLDVSDADDQTAPTEEEQVIIDVVEGPTPPCNDAGLIYCAVKLELAPNTEPEDLFSMSVADARDQDKADHPAGGAEYAKRSQT